MMTKQPDQAHTASAKAKDPDKIIDRSIPAPGNVRSGNLRMKQLTLLMVAIALLGVGCASIGPKKMTGDRFDYSQALSDSWKNQMLMNIVKVRYLDLPIFLDVGQVVSGYTLETGINVSGQVAPVGRGDTYLGLGGHGTFTDRPTITYMPLTGERFLEGFLTPIQPVKVFSLLQSGYAADFVLELCLDSLNGLHNRPAVLASKRQADPEFFQALALLREIQDAGALGIKIEQPRDGRPASVFFFRAENVSEEIRAKAAEVRSLLGVPQDQLEFRLVYSPMRGGPGELGVGTRSLWQILAAMAMGVTIPEAHRERRLVPPLTEISPGETALLRVHSGSSKPSDPYVVVPYEGEWFWIANDDWRSKRTFTSILFIFTLADSDGLEKLPTITIPAQ